MFILAQRGPEGNPKGIKRKPKGKDEEMMTERRKRREWTLLAVVVLFWFAQYVYIPYQTPFLTGKEAAVSEIQNGTERRPLECRTYTVSEIARILGVSRTQAYRLVQEDLFKSVRIGNAIRISKRSFDEWLDSLDL